MDDRVTEMGRGERRGRRPFSLAWSQGSDKRRGRPGFIVAAVVGAVVGAATLPTAVHAQAPPPDAPWRTIRTAHFDVVFPAPLAPLARRAAVLAEDARERLERVFLPPPDDRIEIVLTDHIDTSNGTAEIAPYPKIVIYARPPVDGRALSHYDDWLDLVIVHELAHLVHFDRTGSLGRVLRGVFGRVPSTWPFFPGLATPRWVTEGLATWFESDVTDSGRVRGTTFSMYVRTAALAGRLEGVGRASGATAVWPGGERPYLYGSMFFDWLLARHGEASMAAFVEAVAGQWVPYRLNAAARSAFGESFSEAWDAWVADATARARAISAAIERRSDLPAPELLTGGARQALYPRVSPDGHRWAYMRIDGRSDAGIRIEPFPGDETGRNEEDRDPERLRTNGSSSFDWLPGGGLVFQQFELDGPWRIRSDLYVRDGDGGERRVTVNARLDHPAASPDGRWAAAIRTDGGHTDLVRVDLGDGSIEVVAEGSDSLHWALPAVSPDGRWIAVSRWRPGRLFEPVVVDASQGRVVARLDSVRSVDLGVAWSPDGGTVVFASDRSGIPNLYARDVVPSEGRVGPLRQITDLVSGASVPSVSPDGRWILFSLYTAEGWEAARLPWAAERWRNPVAVRAESRPAPRRRAALDTLEVRPYRAWSTLRPRYWEPVLLDEVRSRGTAVLGPFVGAATQVSDVVERHVVAASAAVAVDRGVVDASLGYTWRGWGNPLVSLSASQGWDAGGPFTIDDDRQVFVEERERRLGLSMTVLDAGWRTDVAVTGSAGIVAEDRTLLDGADLEPASDLRLARPSSRLGDLGVTLSLSTARAHELSISPEQGVQLSVRARTRAEITLADSLRGVAGSDRGVDEVLAMAQAYVSFRGWGWADHVLALRVAVGRARGPGADGFWYDVGGAAGQAEGVTGLGLFGGHRSFFPVRGHAGGDRSGTQAWTATAEWRFPLWWARHGWGLLPVYLDRVHGALFADVGNAWGPQLGLPGYDSPRLDPLAAVGAELRIDTQLFFWVSVQVRAGIAFPLPTDTPRVYLRLGQVF